MKRNLRNYLTLIFYFMNFSLENNMEVLKKIQKESGYI